MLYLCSLITECGLNEDSFVITSKDIQDKLSISDIRYYRHSIFIANYILLHKRRNKGKKNENTISVKELVKNCPLLPLYEDLDKEQRQVYRSIIKPFDTNLKNACMFLGLNYKYDS